MFPHAKRVLLKTVYKKENFIFKTGKFPKAHLCMRYNNETKQFLAHIYQRLN